MSNSQTSNSAQGQGQVESQVPVPLPSQPDQEKQTTAPFWPESQPDALTEKTKLTPDQNNLNTAISPPPVLNSEKQPQHNQPLPTTQPIEK